MTEPTSLDWVSIVGAAQATTARAVVAAASTWSGEDLLGRAADAADWLSRAGLPEGVPVPALLEASPEALALVLAGAATRRPIAPLGPRLTVRELAGCIERLAAPASLPSRRSRPSRRRWPRIWALRCWPFPGCPPWSLRPSHCRPPARVIRPSSCTPPGPPVTPRPSTTGTTGSPGNATGKLLRRELR